MGDVDVGVSSRHHQHTADPDLDFSPCSATQCVAVIANLECGGVPKQGHCTSSSSEVLHCTTTRLTYDRTLQ
jgi:hypothetical protein